MRYISSILLIEFGAEYADTLKSFHSQNPNAIIVTYIAVSICAIATFGGDERERSSGSTVGSSGNVPLLSQSARSDSYSLLEEEKKLRKELKGIDGNDEKDLSFNSPIKNSALLHSGAILGDLPSLSNERSSRGVSAGGAASTSSDINRVLDYGSANSEFPTRSTGPMSPKGNSNYLLDSRADGKDKNCNYSNNIESSAGKGKQKKRDVYAPPPGFPTKFLCQLSQRPMSDPVKSIYGNIFDRSVIHRWMNKQGHICPLSGKLCTLGVSHSYFVIISFCFLLFGNYRVRGPVLSCYRMLLER